MGDEETPLSPLVTSPLAGATSGGGKLATSPYGGDEWGDEVVSLLSLKGKVPAKRGKGFLGDEETPLSLRDISPYGGDEWGRQARDISPCGGDEWGDEAYGILRAQTYKTGAETS